MHSHRLFLGINEKVLSLGSQKDVLTDNKSSACGPETTRAPSCQSFKIFNVLKRLLKQVMYAYSLYSYILKK